MIDRVRRAAQDVPHLPVTGDRYAGEFPRELFRKCGIRYELAEKNKSDLFRDLLPLLNSGRIVLPRNDRLIQQLANLERTTSRAGKDSISHPPNGHDDVANAMAGAADLASTVGFVTDLRAWAGDDNEVRDWQAARAHRLQSYLRGQFR